MFRWTGLTFFTVILSCTAGAVGDVVPYLGDPPASDLQAISESLERFAVERPTPVEMRAVPVSRGSSSFQVIPALLALLAIAAIAAATRMMTGGQKHPRRPHHVRLLQDDVWVIQGADGRVIRSGCLADCEAWLDAEENAHRIRSRHRLREAVSRMLKEQFALPRERWWASRR
jgi:hypothetical protein